MINDRAKAYVNELFTDEENTIALREFKEELIVNLCEKIEDYKIRGLDDDDAFNVAVATLGDVKEVYSKAQPKKREAVRGSRSKRMVIGNKDYTASLFLICVALFIVLGSQGILGGYGTWWILFLLQPTVMMIQQRDPIPALFLMSIMAMPLLAIYGITSPWRWALVLVATGVGLAIDQAKEG